MADDIETELQIAGFDDSHPGDLLFRAADEIAVLRRWKAEATRVIEDWQAVFDVLFDTDSLSPADLGRSKSVIVAREIVRLRCDNGELRTRVEDLEARR